MRTRRRKWHRRGTAAGEFVVAFVAVLAVSGLRILWLGFAALIRGGRMLAGLMWRPQPGASTHAKGGETRERAVPCPLLASDRAKITFDGVAGLEDAKREVLLRTVLPLRFPAQAAGFGIGTGGGVLLWGPPGCGKTLFARAIAGELDACLFHVRASDLMGRWIGEDEKKIAALFGEVRSRDRAVLFIDEIDCLIPSRRRNRSTVMRRIVSEFLSQMDGADHGLRRTPADGYTIVVGATNWPEALDEAVLRPGRFDVTVFVGLPDAEARRRILELSLDEKSVTCGSAIDELVEQTDGFSGADVAALVECAARHAFLRSVRENGAELALTRQDFAAAFERVRPSVSDQDLRRYHACSLAST